MRKFNNVAPHRGKIEKNELLDMLERRLETWVHLKDAIYRMTL